MTGSDLTLATDPLGDPELARLMLRHAAEPMFLMDAEGRVVFANPAAERTFGWAEADLLGKVLHDVVHHHRPDGRPYPMSECPLGHVFLSRRTLERHEDVFFRRDGTPIEVACSNAPVLRSGEMVGAVLVVRDIGGHKAAEAALKSALVEKDALLARQADLLREKDLLTREVHHRVKNSLQLVSALLRLQAVQIADPSAARAFDEACSRVETVARLHERLYRIDNVQVVAFGAFLRELCADLADAISPPAGVRLEVEAVEAEVPTDRAVPLALVVNELATNSLKHAYPEGRKGTIRVSFGTFPGGGYELVVADDGIGLPEGFDLGRSGSLGMRLIRALARQVGGELQVDRAKGARFAIRFAPS